MYGSDVQIAELVVDRTFSKLAIRLFKDFQANSKFASEFIIYRSEVTTVTIGGCEYNGVQTFLATSEGFDRKTGIASKMFCISVQQVDFDAAQLEEAITKAFGDLPTVLPSLLKLVQKISF